MPATAVHAYFAEDLYDILPNTIRKKIDLDRLRMFSQGMDPLMFYNLFSLLPGKKIRKLCKTFHGTKTQDFFINCINYIKRNDFINDKDVCSFLIGMICHYALDSIVHPYVIYRSGVFNKNDRSTYKYNNVHAFMETFLDNDMIQRREDINPYYFKIGQFCFDLDELDNNLIKTIDFSFTHTYNFDNMGRRYYKALRQMKCYLGVFRRDPRGIKKFFYKLLDTFTPKRWFRFEAISYHYPLEDRHNYLNLNHKLWTNPIDKDITSEESFLDLYLRALKLAKVLTFATFDYINDKDIELDQIFNNTSYLSGLNCNIDSDYKYFEF